MSALVPGIARSVTAALLLFSGVSSGLLPGCAGRQRPAPRSAGQTPVSTTPLTVRSLDGADISTRWRGAVIRVAERVGGGSWTLEIPLGGEAGVEGTRLRVRLLGLLPTWTTFDDVTASYTLESFEPGAQGDPVAKVLISEGETEILTDWIFFGLDGMDFAIRHPDYPYLFSLADMIPAPSADDIAPAVPAGRP